MKYSDSWFKRMRMRTARAVLVAALLCVSAARAWAQSSPAASATPGAAGKSYGADVLWYGKAPPGLYGGVGDMQLIAPRTGWAARGGRYYWTSDNGTNWRDITPPSSLISESQVASEGESYEGISDVFFIDSHRGWALFSRHDDPLNEYAQPKFNLASTTDAGSTWTTKRVPLPRKADYGIAGDQELGGWSSNITFGDPQHGWLSVTVAGTTPNTWFSLLLATADGGQTWKQLRHAPAVQDAHALLLTRSEGWLFGPSRPDSEDGGIQVLYVTRDGGDSWQKITLAPPKEIATSDLGKTTCYVMGLPTFENAEHGFLQANCVSARGIEMHLCVVLFTTNDSGRTWKSDRMVANANDYQAHLYGCSAVADSVWIFVGSPGPDLPTFTSRHNVLVTDDVIVTKVEAGARIDARLDAADLRAALPVGLTDSRLDLRFYEDITQCSFVTPSDGWVIVGEGYLKSTTNGGKTWKDIVPGPKPHVIQPHQ